MTKVWHPDRFGEDASLRQKAEEKLKAINEAYETIRRHGPPPPSASSPPPPPRRREIPRTSVSAVYGIACALLALFILLRRPTPAGLVIALVLFGVSVAFVRRMR